MKKHVEPILSMDKEARTKHVATLKSDIMSLSRGIKQGDVSNVRVVRAKRKELARTLTLLDAAPKEASKPTKKEKK